MQADPRLAEQIDYYRARAHEYDEWFTRTGRYDRGPEANERWTAAVESLEQWLTSQGPLGDVLEIACGTGWWTQRLAGQARALTCVDSAPEALEICRTRVPQAEFVEADLFAWTPARTYDTVFFSFWLSHVPAERFAPFWTMVRSCLRPDGRVLFIDSSYNQDATAVDHQLEASGEVTRRLNDGREFRIVKLFYEPDELERRLTDVGFEATVRAVGDTFLCGTARTYRRPR